MKSQMPRVLGYLLSLGIFSVFPLGQIAISEEGRSLTLPAAGTLTRPNETIKSAPTKNAPATQKKEVVEKKNTATPKVTREQLVRPKKTKTLAPAAKLVRTPNEATANVKPINKDPQKAPPKTTVNRPVRALSPAPTLKLDNKRQAPPQKIKQVAPKSTPVKLDRPVVPAPTHSKEIPPAPAAKPEKVLRALSPAGSLARDIERPQLQLQPKTQRQKPTETVSPANPLWSTAKKRDALPTKPSADRRPQEIQQAITRQVKTKQDEIQPKAKQPKVPKVKAAAPEPRFRPAPSNSATLDIRPPGFATKPPPGSSKTAKPKKPEKSVTLSVAPPPTVSNRAEAAKQNLAVPPTVTFLTTDSNKKRVLIDRIWRIRRTSTSVEPKNAWVIYHAGGRFYAVDQDASVLEVIKKRVELKKFTAPNDSQIYIVPSKIDHVLEAVNGKHHPKAKSLIISKWGSQQVQEPTFAVNRSRQSRSVN